MSEEAKAYDPIRNHLPYGGAVNIYGEIVRRITEMTKIAIDSIYPDAVEHAKNT
jgi:hypothetical protein